MFSTTKFRSFINNSAEKINNKLDKIEAKRLLKVTMKEESLAQKAKQKEEWEQKQEAQKNYIKEQKQNIKKTITKKIDLFIVGIKMFFHDLLSIIKKFIYVILYYIVSKIKHIYVRFDYIKSVKNHKKLIKKLYDSASINDLSKNHDVDLLSKYNIKTAINGIEPIRHKYINKHHLDYWAKDSKITEIPFEQTLEIICDLFATAYNQTNNVIDYMLILELFKEKTEEYFISGVLVDYFIDSITYAQQNKLTAPDYAYCLKKYNNCVLF